MRQDWLDLAYVYWFDEPDEKDYAFVRQGMERLKKYAPRIRRLLTEEPVKELTEVVNLSRETANFAARLHRQRGRWHRFQGHNTTAALLQGIP